MDRVHCDTFTSLYLIKERAMCRSSHEIEVVIRTHHRYARSPIDTAHMNGMTNAEYR